MALNMNEGFIVASWRTSFPFCKGNDEGEDRSFNSLLHFAREENLWMGLQPCAPFAEPCVNTLNEAGFTVRLLLSSA